MTVGELTRPLRSRFERVPGQHRPRRARDGAIFAVLIALGLTLGLAREIPFTGGGGEPLRAHFAEAPNLRPGHPVRVAGVDVGEVTEIERDPRGGVLVSMRIEDDGVEVRRDAFAALRWRTIFGRNLYVDLDPGSRPAPLLGEAVIPEFRTETQVEFDQFLAPFDGSGRRALRTTLRELEVGLADPRGPGETIERLEPSLANVTPALQGMTGERAGDLRRLVARAGGVMAALAADERRLAELVEGGATSIAVLARRRSDLGKLLQASPPTLRETEATMVRLRRTLDLLDPLAEELRPGVRRLDEAARAAIPALREATPVLRLARPLVRRLGPTAEALRAASGPGIGTFRGLRPSLRRASGEILPFLDRRGEIGLRNYEAVGPFFSSWATSMAQFDRYGHWNRFQVFGGERLLTTLPCDTFFTTPGEEERVRCDALSGLLSALSLGGPR